MSEFGEKGNRREIVERMTADIKKTLRTSGEAAHKQAVEVARLEDKRAARGDNKNVTRRTKEQAPVEKTSGRIFIDQGRGKK